MSVIDDGSKRTGWSRRGGVKKIALGVLGLYLVFSLGVGVGRGAINLSVGTTSNKSLPANLDYSSVEQVYDTLRKNYDGSLDQTKLLDGLKEGLVKASGDPYTEYMPPEDAKAFDEQLNGSFTGIGAELGKGADGKTVIIVSPIAGFPADKAGLRPKDIIAEIDGKSAYDISLDEAVKQIRGPKGTKVNLKIVRDQQPLSFTIERDQITIPSVESKMLDDTIGYIKVSRFSEDTVKLTQDAAVDFKQKNVKGVILDVRGDPGGLLDAAVGVSSIWLPAGKTVLQEKRAGVVTKTYRSEGSAILAGVPTVVLINDGSASASEITAGALRDNKAATLLGVKSFGKGSVQEVERLANGGILKITIARWYTPGDKNIDKAGIEPDQKVDRTEDDYKNNKDPQLDAAIAKLK